MGLYRSFILSLDGTAVAFIEGAVVRGSFKVPYMAFDPRVLRKYSIGTALTSRAIAYCIAHGYKEYDLTRGSEQYKQLLGARANVNLHMNVYRGRIAKAAEPVAARLTSWSKRMCAAISRSRHRDEQIAE